MNKKYCEDLNSRDAFNKRQRSIDKENRNTIGLGNFMDAMDNDGRFMRGFFEWSNECYNWGCEVDIDVHVVVTTAYDTSNVRVTLFDTSDELTILDEDMVPRDYAKVIEACKRLTSHGDYYDFPDLEEENMVESKIQRAKDISKLLNEASKRYICEKAFLEWLEKQGPNYDVSNYDAFEAGANANGIEVQEENYMYWLENFAPNYDVSAFDAFEAGWDLA